MSEVGTFESAQARLARAVRAGSAAVDAAIREHGTRRLGEHAERLLRYTRPAAPIQSPDDLVEAARVECAELLGDAVAAKLARQLRAHPVIDTGSHHGPLVFPPFFQGICAFSLAFGAGDVMPLFGTSRGRLSDQTFPRGVRLMGGAAVTFFGKSEKATLIATAPACDASSTKRVAEQLGVALARGEISEGQHQAFERTILEDLRDPEVLRLPSFAAQSTVMNFRLWKRLDSRSEGGAGPDLVSLASERVTGRLLANDLLDPKSLAHRVLFDREARNAVMHHLDGLSGCWDRSRLAHLANPTLTTKEREKLSAAAGSAFFWGVGERGRGVVHLALVDGDSSEPKLRGIDSSGSSVCFPLTPDALIDGLTSQKLIPTSFVTFLELSFSRGFTCLGGFRQIAYLPTMQTSFAKALEARELFSFAERVRSVPTEEWTLGLVPMLARGRDGKLDLAGPIEVLAAGGLTQARLTQLREVTVADAVLSMLPTMYSMAPKQEPDLAAITTTDVAREALDRLIVLDV